MRCTCVGRQQSFLHRNKKVILCASTHSRLVVKARLKEKQSMEKKWENMEMREKAAEIASMSRIFAKTMTKHKQILITDVLKSRKN